MFLEFKKYYLRFSVSGIPSLVAKDDVNEVIGVSQIGMVFNYGPPHDHNWKSVYLEEMHDNHLDGNDRIVHVCVESICDKHKGHYCGCHDIRKPILVRNKVIMDLYNLAPTTSEHTIIFY